MKKTSFELFVTEKVGLFVELHENEGNKNLNFLIRSNGYKGHGPLYLFSDNIKKYIKDLKNMLKTLTGECCIEDTESSGYIKTYFKGRDLFAKGSIGDYGTHMLTFEFRADQTLLIPFVKVLEQLL